MKEQKLRCAYIDNNGFNRKIYTGFFIRAGIEITSSDTLDNFLAKYDLNDFPVLLYHPGVGNQGDLRRVRQEFPNLVVALFVPESQELEYNRVRSDVPVLTSSDGHLDKALDFIRINQGGRR